MPPDARSCARARSPRTSTRDAAVPGGSAVSQTMLPPVVIEREVHLFQDERRRAHLILPDQRRAIECEYGADRVSSPRCCRCHPVWLSGIPATRNCPDESRRMLRSARRCAEGAAGSSLSAPTTRTGWLRPPRTPAPAVPARIGDLHIAQQVRSGVDTVPAGFDATDADQLAETLADHLFDVGSMISILGRML